MEIIHHIESARWLPHEDSAIEIAGWCFCPNAFVNAVEAYVGGAKIAFTATEERSDVELHHGGNPHALCSGFKISLPLVELESVIELCPVVGIATLPPFYFVRAGDLPNRGAILPGYPQWAMARRAMEPRLAAELLAQLPKGNSGPLVSLLLPVFNTPSHFLTECVESVLQQIYPHWELRIVDDGSTRSGLRDLLASFAERDARISVEMLPTNRGISRATNHALANARGEFVGFIDHDDRLHAHALAEVVRRILTTGAIATYTDEEKITVDGAPCSGIFKPDFSPELLRGVMYIGHFLCVRTAVAREIGGFNPHFDGIQDFEFALRLSEHSPRIAHIPRVLYQWRISPQSSAQSGNVKGDMDQLQFEAVTEHLRRIGRSAAAVKLGAHRLRVVPTATGSSRRIAILARDESCLAEIDLRGAHEILILDEATVRGLNRALERSRSEHVFWLNERLAIEPSSAIRALAGFLDESSVGAAAPALLASDGKIFACGAVLTAGRKITPAMRGFSRDGDGYNGSLACNREVSAVPSACAVFRKEELLETLSDSAHPLSDTGMAELCLAIQRRGLRILACASFQFGTKRSWAHQGVLGEISTSWIDPYYNPQLDADRGDYRLRESQKSA